MHVDANIEAILFLCTGYNSTLRIASENFLAEILNNLTPTCKSNLGTPWERQSVSVDDEFYPLAIEPSEM